jgi:MFS family permease
MRTKMTDTKNNDEQAQGRKMFLIEGIMASSEANTFMGNLLTAYALAIGSSDRQIGMLSTARNLAGFAQLLTSHILQRIGSKRRLFYHTFGISRTIRIIVAFLPTIPLAFVSNDIAWWLITLMFLVSAGDSITLILKKTWMSEITPPEIRGRYFGLRSLLSDFSGMLMGYFGGLYIDHSRSLGREVFGFQSIFLFSTLIGYSTLFLVSRIPETSRESERQGLKDFIKSFKLPFKDKPFLIWTIYDACYSFAVGFAGPFFTVYLLKGLNLPLATVAIYTAIGEISSIALSRWWGSLADKYGNLTILTIACIGKSIFPALWIFTSGANTLWAILWLVFVHSVRGFNSAQSITTLNMTLALSPEKDRPVYLACESTVVNLLSSISPFIGGLLLGAMGEKYIETSMLGWNQILYPMHLLFLISAILRGSASLILIKVRSSQK